MKTITRRNLFCIVFAFLVFCIALVFLTVDTPKAYAETESAPFTIIGETSGKEYYSGGYTNERVKIIITDSSYTRLYYKSPLGNSYTYTKNGYWVTNAANGLFKFYATTEDGHKSIEGTIYFDNKNPEGKIYSNGSSVDSGSYISEGFYYNATDEDSGIAAAYYKTPTDDEYQKYTLGTLIPANAGDGWYNFYSVDKSGNESDIHSVYLESVVPQVEIYRNKELAYSCSMNDSKTYYTNLYFNTEDILEISCITSSGRVISNYELNTEIVIDDNFAENSYVIDLTTKTGIEGHFIFNVVHSKPTIIIDNKTYYSGAILYFNQDTLVQWNCDEGITDTKNTGVTISVEGESSVFIKYSEDGEYVLSADENTEKEYTLILNDLAGNESVFQICVDKLAPSGIWITDGVELENNAYTNHSLTFIFDTSKVTASYSRNGEEYSIYTNGTILELDGSYNIILTDLAGNKQLFSAHIDTVKPIGQLYADNIPIDSGTITNNTIFFSWNGDITATVNGAKYVKNSLLQQDGLYSFILTDYAGNQSHYTVTIDTICPAYNFDKLNKLQRNITLWYIASIDGADYSFATYNEALAFACDKEFEKNVTVLNLDNIDDFNQHHLVAGNTEIRLGEYWLYKSKTNADILLYYFDKTLLKEAISYYAKNFVSDKNHFENNGNNRYGTTAESMNDNLCCSIDGMSVPFVNDFVFDCYDSVKIFAELAEGNGTKTQLAYGCKFSEQINVGGLYKITEIDAAENVKVYYCYYDSFAPTLNVEAKIYGDNAPTNLSVSQDGLQGISAYFYESFSIKEIVDADKWTVVTVENNNIKKHFTYGEELPRLIIGGEYQLTVYDRFNNTYSFTVYIVGNPATITFRNNIDDSIFTLSIALEQSFDTIVSLEILRNGETVSGVTTDKLSYEFCDNGIYLVRLKDNFGRVVTSEYSFNVIVEDTVAPTITLRGVTNGGKTKRPVVIDELSEQANVEVYKDGQLIEYKLGDELSLYGEYVVVITDLANNVSTYCFTIEHSLNLGSILIIVLSVLILLSAIIAVILIRKIGIFGKRKNFKSDSNSVKND